MTLIISWCIYLFSTIMTINDQKKIEHKVCLAELVDKCLMSVGESSGGV